MGNFCIIMKNMDWYTIEFLYPESFKKFVVIMFPNLGILSVSTLENYDIKKLYSFFDREGVYLNIEITNQNQCLYSISLSNGAVFGPTQSWKSNRDEVEVDGFSECFKLLDKKIRDLK